jgi:hypothetical protein
MFTISREEVQLAQTLARKIAFNYGCAREEYYRIHKAVRDADPVLQNLIQQRKNGDDFGIESQIETRLVELDTSPVVEAARDACHRAGSDWGAVCDILNQAKE